MAGWSHVFASTAVSVSALVAGLLVGPATAAGEPMANTAVETGAVFNDPNGTAAEQYAIRDHIVELTAASEPGSTISASIYNLTDFDLGYAEELVAAAERGVRVRVVLETVTARPDREARDLLLERLGTDRGQASWVATCTEGCHGTRHNHNKFYLFSDVGGQRDVVVQSSANLTVSNGNRAWNNAVTIVDNAELYQAYLDYFGDLARDVTDLDYYTTVNAGAVKTYHFPRAGSGATGDTVYNTLGNVACTGNVDVGTADGRTIIRVGMWYFGRTAVAERLAALAREGCEVDIVYTRMLDGPRNALSGVPNVTLSQLPDDEDGTIIHSKYYLIEGSYADAERTVVFTGSPNFSNAALRANDETMVRIYNERVHDQYVANFADVRADAR